MKPLTAFNTSSALSSSYTVSTCIVGLRHAFLTALRLAVASLKNVSALRHSTDRCATGLVSSSSHLRRMVCHVGLVLGSNLGSFNDLPNAFSAVSISRIRWNTHAVGRANA